MSTYLGIDPGLDGALCIYTAPLPHAINGPAGTVDIIDMPTVEIKIGKSIKRRLDYQQVAGWLDIVARGVTLAALEDVTASPQMGVSSAFAFGELYGAVRMAVAANAVPIHLVRPNIWKSRFGLLRQTKDASRAAASRIAPAFSHHWPLKKHDGRAEAFLLAVYGSRM